MCFQRQTRIWQCDKPVSPSKTNTKHKRVPTASWEVNLLNRSGDLTGKLLELTRGSPLHPSLGRICTFKHQKLLLKGTINTRSQSHTCPTQASNCTLWGVSSVLSQNSELSSELTANKNSPGGRRAKNGYCRRTRRGKLNNILGDDNIPSAAGRR